MFFPDLRLPQLGPVNAVFEQSQENLFHPSWQTPPCRHGLDSPLPPPPPLHRGGVSWHVEWTEPEIRYEDTKF